ncbi:helix-turn-helix transcriptional regulator [uncultured Tenacibaculum sp.]|uniref:helix-turn-helix transcriptional regulator n=1 Tax=uncultured Tenacibaculum sp. TaxID=174713 RepID=UPI0026298F4F|nr:helix-turn-helix transcriptional regulator [uncultured Tenacibaculum sp.]
MIKLSKGNFFGNHYQKVIYDGICITDTEYIHSKVDWHYHENPYFTYILEGEVYEENKKEGYHLSSGSLVYHNWQDSHFNIKPPKFTRGFHIELSPKWFEKNNLSHENSQGSIHINNPLIKQCINKIFVESKIQDTQSLLSIEMLLSSSLDFSQVKEKINNRIKPKWVSQLKDILHSNEIDTLNLNQLATVLNIHPVYLSREFPKHFNTTIGNYIRTQKINKALILIAQKKLSMTEICYECGFYDQSHFINSFKKIYHQSPLKISKIIKEVNYLQF